MMPSSGQNEASISTYLTSNNGIGCGAYVLMGFDTKTQFTAMKSPIRKVSATDNNFKDKFIFLILFNLWIKF